MIHKIELNINLDVIGLSLEKLLQITDNLVSCDGKISFDELNKIFIISDRPYHVSSIDFPKLDSDDFSIKTTKIEIVG